MVEQSNGEPEKLSPVTIHFGDVFTRRQDPSQRYVIVDVGSGDTCHSSRIIEVEGVEAIGFFGTTFRGHIGNINPEKPWSLERIIKARRVHSKYKFLKMEEDMLRSVSEQEPRLFPS